MRLSSKIGLVLTLLGCSTVSVAAEPGALVKRLLGETFETLKDASLSQEQKTTKIHTLLGQQFDLATISRGVLGRHWRSASEQDRNDFTQLFAKILARRLIKSLEDFNRDTVHYKGERVKENNTARVYVDFVRGEQRWLVSYGLWQRQQKWMVYDLSFTGFSLVKAYRRDYHHVINKDGVAGLVKILAEDLNKPAENQTALRFNRSPWADGVTAR